MHLANVEVGKRTTQTQTQTALHAMLGSILLERGSAAEALSELARAKTMCDGDPILSSLILDLSRAARAKLPETGAPGSTAVDARTAIETAIAHAQSAPASDSEQEKDQVLLVQREGHWFRVPDREVVHCRSRQTVRALLAKLAEYRCSNPGMPVHSEELRTIGWPGERMSLGSARERLKQAMRVLRRLGLEQLVVWKDGGYLLSTDISIELC